MKMINFKNVCTKCNNIQEVTEKDIYQDIEGKYIICNNCEKTYNVEPEYID